MSESQSTDKTSKTLSENKQTHSKAERGEPNEDYGYYFYPEREGREGDKNLWSKVMQGRQNGRSLKCITNIYWCVEKSKYKKKTQIALFSTTSTKIPPIFRVESAGGDIGLRACALNS